MNRIPGIKPFVVLATRTDDGTLANHLTGSFDTEYAARNYIKDCIPDHYTATVYEITAKEIPPDHHHRAELIARNGRWGTCGGCPRDAKGNVFPERCDYTTRSDHNISPDDNIIISKGR